jgi:hypothetical protein
VGWVLDHLDDIESDLSAIHRIEDMWGMEAGRFFRFAHRLPAYKGAMRAVAERLAHEEERRKEARGLTGREVVAVPAGELTAVPALAGAAAAGLIDFG